MKIISFIIAGLLAAVLVCSYVTVEAQGGITVSGKVVETMDSGGYTYVRVEQKGAKTWVAVPPTKVKVGQKITFQPGMEMVNFESKTLNRKFDRIIFSSGVAK